MDLLERADELGRQLSAAIENVLLLDAVLRSRRELENTFNSLADLVAVSDQDGRLVSREPGVPRAHRHDAAGADRSAARRGRRRLQLSELIRARDRADPAIIRGSTPTIVSAEVDDPKLRGTFHGHADAARRRRARAIGIVLVARDMTPQAELEAEREELRNRLAQSEKLAALGQFVAGIAHELNNPLQGVLGHLELLRATGAFPKALRRDMQRIYREADRAAKIVRNLLVFAGSRRLVRRRTQRQRRAVSGCSRCARRRSARPNIEVVRHYDGQLPRVKGDPLLLHQVFLNIVLNAEQAIGATAAAASRSRTSVRRDGAARRSSCRFATPGPGIPPDGDAAHLRAVLHDERSRERAPASAWQSPTASFRSTAGRSSASNHPDGGAVFTVQLPVENG